jgi:DNA replication protein DnaC
MNRDIQTLRERIAATSEGHAAMKAAAIAKGVAEHGWSEDADCSICGDTGVVANTNLVCRCPAGRAEALRQKADAAQNELNQRWIDSKVPRRFRDYRLDGAPNQAVAAQVRAWLDDRPLESGANLIITGPVGVGKTGLAIGALWELQVYDPQGRGPSPMRFAGVPALLDALRPDSGDGHSMRECQWAACLVLDDLGASRGTEWEQERLYVLINARYEAQKPTIVTTNVGVRELAESLGERTISRLTELASVVVADGSDLRRSGRAA